GIEPGAVEARSAIEFGHPRLAPFEVAQGGVRKGGIGNKRRLLRGSGVARYSGPVPTGTAAEKESPVIFADSLPDFKSLLKGLALPLHFLCHVSAFVSAFVLHKGSIPGPQPASLCQQPRRHLATLTRFLAEVGHSSDLLACARCAALLLEAELARQGDFLFILDGTKRHSQGRFMENSYSCGNTK